MGALKELGEILAEYPAAVHWRVNGRTVLMDAVKRHQTPAVNLLLKSKSDPNAMSDDNLSSPVIEAAANGDEQMLVILIHAGAKLYLAKQGDMTPLMAAIAAKKHKVIPVLLTHGASHKLLNDEGNAPLHMATSTGAFNEAKALLAGKADIDQRNLESLTPLMLAAKEKNLAAAKFLLDNGADDTLLSDLRETALDMARAFAGGDKEFLSGYEALMQERLTKRTEAFLPQMRKGTAHSMIAPEPAKFRRKQKPAA